MKRRTARGVAVGTLLALTGALLAVSGAPAPASPAVVRAVVPVHDGRHTGGQDGDTATLPTDFTDKVAIGGLSEPTSVAFAPDGTAFIGLKTGLVKSFDHDAGTRQYEPFATHTKASGDLPQDLTGLVTPVGHRQAREDRLRCGRDSRAHKSCGGTR